MVYPGFTSTRAPPSLGGPPRGTADPIMVGHYLGPGARRGVRAGEKFDFRLRRLVSGYRYRVSVSGIGIGYRLLGGVGGGSDSRDVFAQLRAPREPGP